MNLKKITDFDSAVIQSPTELQKEAYLRLVSNMDEWEVDEYYRYLLTSDKLSVNLDPEFLENMDPDDIADALTDDIFLEAIEKKIITFSEKEIEPFLNPTSVGDTKEAINAALISLGIKERVDFDGRSYFVQPRYQMSTSEIQTVLEALPEGFTHEEIIDETTNLHLFTKV